MSVIREVYTAGFLAALLVGQLASAKEPFLSSPLGQGFSTSNVFDHSVDQTPDRILSAWGFEVPGKSGHLGLDWPMPEGTPIYAAADGLVEEAGDQGRIKCDGEWVDSSIRVRLGHRSPEGERVITTYLHLSRVTVRAKEAVVAGQLIGYSGNTGCSTGPHLHFGVVRPDFPKGGGRAQDPYGWHVGTEDPRVTKFGSASYWMWLPSKAPPLYYAKRRKAPKQAMGIVGVVPVDFLHPVHEYIELATKSQVVSLDGYSVRNNAGDRYFFASDAKLTPGRRLRLYTGGEGSALDVPDKVDALFWGKSEGVWRNVGDCVRLMDPTGKEVDVYQWGRKGTTFCSPLERR